jgi:AcrR family transcriptional regulator
MTPKVSDPVRASETEAAILEAARDLLAEGGLEAVSMRSVAARVGLSATAIYNYFENKGDLVRRVVHQGFDRFTGYLKEAVTDLPMGSRERLRAHGRAYLRFATENPEYFRVIFAAHGDPEELDTLPGGGGYPMFRKAVVEAMEAGTIREADPDMVVVYLWTLVHGLVTLQLAFEPDARCPHSGERLSGLELFERFADFVYLGLGPEGKKVGETADAAVS